MSDADNFSDSEGAAALTQPVGDTTAIPGDFSLQPPEPLVQPMVRLLAQFVSPWGPMFMRGPGQRNTAAQPTANDNWAQNGCYPTCIAMILRWWSEDNPETAGKLDGSFPARQSTLDPQEACQRLFGNSFVPCVANSASPDKQTELANKGYDNPAIDFTVGESDLRNAVRAVHRNDFPGPLLQTLTVLSAPMVDPILTRQLTLKWWLQFGPVIALMSIPGHYVVIDGYRGNTIYICDPGNILMNKNIWMTMPRLRTGAELPPGESVGSGYVAVDDTQNYQAANGTFNGPWLSKISRLDAVFLDQFNIHPQWSDLSVGRQ